MKGRRPPGAGAAASCAAAVLAGLLAASACRRAPGPPTGALADLLGAAQSGNAARIRSLIAEDPGLARASWEGAPNGPVRAAAQGGHAEVVRLLIEAGADARERDNRGHTPLHAAKSAEVARVLLERGVSPDVAPARARRRS